VSALAALADLRARGVELRADGDLVRYRAPKGTLTPQLRRALADYKAELLAELEAEAARGELDRIEAGLAERNGRLLALYRAGDRAAAERLHAEVHETVTLEWLPAMRRRARAADRAGQLPDADRFLVDDPDVEAAAGGWRRVASGWAETPARARRCVVHADRALAAGDRLYCPECRVGADAPAPRGWRCVCHSTERRYREQWGDWVCAREQCGMIVPSPRERP
jgi:hypothetical protein